MALWTTYLQGKLRNRRHLSLVLQGEARPWKICMENYMYDILKIRVHCLRMGLRMGEKSKREIWQIKLCSSILKKGPVNLSKESKPRLFIGFVLISVLF